MKLRKFDFTGRSPYHLWIKRKGEEYLSPKKIACYIDKHTY